MTETAVETPAEVIISDGSHVAEGALTKLRNCAKRSAEKIVQAPAAMAAATAIFIGVATERATARTYILLDDNEPDWAGGSQTYKLNVNAAERDAFESFSDDMKKSFDTNVRSHMRRTVLEPIIVKWSADKLGIAVTTPDKSPELAKEVRRQYDRCKLAIPDKWRDTPPTGSGPGTDAIVTPVSKVLAGALALKEIPSVVERIGYVHKMLSDMLADICQPNAVVTGGRQSAAKALAEVANLSTTGFKILDGQLTGDELAAVRAKFEKHLYQD